MKKRFCFTLSPDGIEVLRLSDPHELSLSAKVDRLVLAEAAHIVNKSKKENP